MTDPRAALAEHGRLFVATGGATSSPDTVHTKPAEKCRALRRAPDDRRITRPAELPRNASVCRFCAGEWTAGGGGSKLSHALRQADPAEVFDA